MSDLRTIATVRKNNSEEIRISVAVHDGFTLVDMRVFSTPRGARGEPHPTKAGICLNRTTLPELILALQAAEREAVR
ncbi:hypothetical protein ASG40_17310 [Methylobacterium sp. Leaf399]|uniref:transcriptional coactivator p15/PC4 family protein n=1 Tax=Methylobacterium sp. Leaf399 TaxID=1736364 RepID=UPI00070057B6|nr:transcriptional coactivator p15/PC4 family protein [Methylobacterium sp. Leaf399]KQT17769.1 hypothetical protein ASG40_17310 [Methylobacterium sp. Leaf399]